MPERIEKLRATLGELEIELASLSEIDDETREVLNDALGEIQSALKQAPGDIKHQSLADRLKDATEDFESSHPTLFGIVSRTIDALGQMGI